VCVLTWKRRIARFGRMGRRYHIRLNLFIIVLWGGQEGENVTVFKQLWRCKSLPSALVTAWRVLENKLATRLNLEKRGIAVESPLCSLCRVEEESNSHLFFECSFVWLVWSRCFAWLECSLCLIMIHC